jgi:hypothetical protein
MTIEAAEGGLVSLSVLDILFKYDKYRKTFVCLVVWVKMQLQA